jgi:hypothetical protein
MDLKQIIAILVFIAIMAIIVVRNWDTIAHRGK